MNINKTNSEIENGYPIGTLVRFSSGWGIVMSMPVNQPGALMLYRQKVWSLTTGKKHFVDTRWMTTLKSADLKTPATGGRYRT